MSPPKDLQSSIREHLWREEKPPENTDRAQLARLGLDINRDKLNAFIEKIAPNTGHEHDDDGFIIPTLHNVQLHLWATEERIEVRAKVHGVPVAPTAPRGHTRSILERCAEQICDGIASIPNPLMDQTPAWARAAVDHELAMRAEYFASLAGTSKALALSNAIAAVEEELVRRGATSPEYVIPALMEAGLSCSWVKDRPPGEVPFVGCAPALRALVYALGRAGAVPYVHLEASFDGDGPHKLSVGGEVVACEKYDLITSLHGFVTRPSAQSFDFLLGALARIENPAEIIGDGPIASWCREQIKAQR